MADTKTLIEQAYAALNNRDIDGALALMAEDVSWPKASEGGKVVGKEEIRGYWTRQWGEFDPHVEPLGGWPDHDPKHKGCPVHDCSIVMSGMRMSGLPIILATPQIPLMDKQCSVP